MSSTDRSQTERIRRLRGKIQAVRRAECPRCPEEGPQGPTDQSTRLSRSFGQMVYYTETATGAPVVQSCCPPSEGGGGGCCIGTANFTDFEAYVAEYSPPNVPTSFTVNVSDCSNMTFTYLGEGNIPIQINALVQFVQEDFTFDSSAGFFVIINNSNHTVIATDSGFNNTQFTLNPCGVVPSATAAARV